MTVKIRELQQNALLMDMDQAEAVAAGIRIMQHLTVTTAGAALGDSCYVVLFEGVRTHRWQVDLPLRLRANMVEPRPTCSRISIPKPDDDTAWSRK